MTDHSKAARRFDDSEVYDALRAVAKKVGHPPTTGEYRDHRTSEMPADVTIQARHDDSKRPWLSALTEAGLEPDPADHGGVPADAGRVVFVLSELRDQLGHWPSPDEYRDSGALPSVPTLYDRYGSWPDAIDAARSEGRAALGTGQRSRGIGRPRKYSDEECRNALRDALEAQDDAPLSMSAYRRYRSESMAPLPSAGTILDRLGDRSWTAAVQSVGGETERAASHSYTREEVAAAVAQARRDLGDDCSVTEYEEWAVGRPNTPSQVTLYDHFDSWGDACEAARDVSGE